MSQVFGFPGTGISLGHRRGIIFASGDPNAATAPADARAAAVGSLYSRTDVAGLYFCTVAGALTNGALTSGATWQQITIP
jgi:hypothetical protein